VVARLGPLEVEDVSTHLLILKDPALVYRIGASFLACLCTLIPVGNGKIRAAEHMPDWRGGEPDQV
jgi:hypothetical protein